MRLSILAVLTLAVMAAYVPSAQARKGVVVRDYKYCLQGRSAGYPGDCRFVNFQQCLASASGTSDYCGINPRYAFATGDWRPD